MLRKSRFLLLLLVCLLTAALITGCGSSSKPADGAKTDTKKPAAVVIKLAHENVPKHPMGMAFIKFKELVESRSKGEIKVDLYDSGKFGGGREIVEGLQSGMLQMGSSSTPNLQPFSNAFLIFDMPFLFPDYPSTDKITDGPLGKKMAGALEKHNVLGLGYIEIGFRNIYNNKRPVEKMEDMQGLKIRSTASKAHIATLKALGASPTPVAWGEVYTAMQQKTVDGIDIDLNLAWFNNFHEVQTQMTIVNSIYSPHLVMINKAFYDKLSPAHKKIVDETFNEIKLYQRKLIRDNEKMIMDEYKKKGLKIVVLSAEERARWAKQCEAIYAEFEKEIGKDVLDEAKKTLTAK